MVAVTLENDTTKFQMKDNELVITNTFTASEINGSAHPKVMKRLMAKVYKSFDDNTQVEDIEKTANELGIKTEQGYTWQK